MNNFSFCSPTEFVFGKETENKTGTLCKKYGATKVLIIYGGGSVVRSGLLQRVKDSLQDAGIEYVEMCGVQPNPIDTKVYEGIKIARDGHVDMLLPVGGGSVIDTAKAIAAGVTYEGDFWDFFLQKKRVDSALKIGVVLTIPAAGSEGSGNTVITRTDGLHKLSLRTATILRPLFAIMNPELTYSLPPFQTACGISDMMAHIMERYFTNTIGVDVTDRICEGLLISIIKNARIVMKYPFDYDARANLMWSGTIAHNGICGVGREEDWASHFMEHEISAVYNVAHGAGLSVIFPAWLSFMAQHHIEKVYQFATRVWNVEDNDDKYSVAIEGIDRMKKFFVSIGLPINFDELGVPNPDIDLLVEKLHENKGNTIGTYMPIDREKSRIIYQMAIQ